MPSFMDLSESLSPPHKKQKTVNDDDSHSDRRFDLNYLSDEDFEERERQYNLFLKQALKSQGFDINFEEFSYSYDLSPVEMNECLFDSSVGTDGEMMAVCAQRALEKYNQEKGTNLKFEKVVKANWRQCMGFLYWITFLVKDPSCSNEDLKFYQAKVHDFVEIEVLFCRPKPPGEELPEIEIVRGMLLDY